MKNIFLFLVAFISNQLLSTDLKSNQRSHETEQIQKLFHLIERPNKEELNKLLLHLKESHILSRMLNAKNKTTKLIPLHHALAQDFNNYFTLELLLTYGADPNKATHEKARTCGKTSLKIPKGSTAAHLAILGKKPMEILALLQLHGCDFGDTFHDTNNDTPLTVAQKHNNQLSVDFITSTCSNRDTHPSSTPKSRRSSGSAPHEIHFIEVIKIAPSPSTHQPADVNNDHDTCCCYYPCWLVHALCCNQCGEHDD